MIKSKYCVYCGITIRKSNNAPDGRSVEHLIPNSAVSKKRTNAKGDFNVCRGCNTQKSKIDQLFGLLSRISAKGGGGDEAITEISKLYKKNDKRIRRMIDSASDFRGGKNLKLPFKGEDIYDYGVFLTKGQYFKERKELLNLDEKVVIVKWLGPNASEQITELYQQQSNNRDRFKDLAMNKSVEDVGGECFIVANSKSNQFLFFFNELYLLITEIVDLNEKSKLEKRTNKQYLIAGFTNGKPNKYCI